LKVDDIDLGFSYELFRFIVAFRWKEIGFGTFIINFCLIYGVGITDIVLATFNTLLFFLCS